ncbi:MAG: hypothetical protein LKF42_00010 [Streptococcaceae bacterium]|jgi:hypothetical protein|nr:hypothetical protein [Streptococcaceae bacterium]MCH4176115.1 hypothetical protein [Streptococcaceae bacterium]
MDDLIIGLIAILLFFSLILIGIGYITRLTGGLFWSRSPQTYLRDLKDPRFIKEREVGNQLSTFLLKYIPPISIILLFILVLLIFHIL